MKKKIEKIIENNGKIVSKEVIYETEVDNSIQDYWSRNKDRIEGITKFSSFLTIIIAVLTLSFQQCNKNNDDKIAQTIRDSTNRKNQEAELKQQKIKFQADTAQTNRYWRDYKRLLENDSSERKEYKEQQGFRDKQLNLQQKNFVDALKSSVDNIKLQRDSDVEKERKLINRKLFAEISKDLSIIIDLNSSIIKINEATNDLYFNLIPQLNFYTPLNKYDPIFEIFKDEIDLRNKAKIVFDDFNQLYLLEESERQNLARSGVAAFANGKMSPFVNLNKQLKQFPKIDITKISEIKEKYIVNKNIEIKYIEELRSPLAYQRKLFNDSFIPEELTVLFGKNNRDFNFNYDNFHSTVNLLFNYFQSYNESLNKYLNESNNKNIEDLKFCCQNMFNENQESIFKPIKNEVDNIENYQKVLNDICYIRAKKIREMMLTALKHS